MLDVVYWIQVKPATSTVFFLLAPLIGDASSSPGTFSDVYNVMILQSFCPWVFFFFLSFSPLHHP